MSTVFEPSAFGHMRIEVMRRAWSTEGSIARSATSHPSISAETQSASAD
jgi:hypothetical protein